MVGACGCDGATKGFVTDGKTFTLLAFPGSPQTSALGINNLGDIVGSYEAANGLQHAFVLSGDAFTSIIPPNSLHSVATGINNHGDVVGYYLAGDIQPEVSPTAMASSLTLTFRTRCHTRDGVGHRRGVVGPGGPVTSWSASPIFEADECGRFSRKLLYIANGINLNGDIVGNYGDAGGPSHGYLRNRGSN